MTAPPATPKLPKPPSFSFPVEAKIELCSVISSRKSAAITKGVQDRQIGMEGNDQVEARRLFRQARCR